MSTILRSILALAGALLVAPHAAAGEREGIGYLHVSWTEKDGLPGSYIGAMAQDRDGYLWLVANGALVRFDGVRFVEWNVIGPPAFRNLRPTVLSASSDGALWIGLAGDGGVSRFKDGEITTYVALPSIQARGFAADERGGMWITGLDHPFRSVAEPDRATLSASLLQSASGGWTLELDSRVATLGAGGWRVSRAHEAEPVIDLFGRNRLSSAVVRSLLEDREGNIWVGTDNGLNRLTPSALTSQPPALASVNRPVVAMTADKRGDVWAGTQTGLYHFSGASARRFDRRDGLPGVAIYALHTDDEGTLWAAGDQLGLVRRGADGSFTSIALPRSPPLRIVALTSDRSGALWLCDTDWGVFRWKDGRLTSVPGTLQRAAYSAFTDSKGRVWIGLINRVLVVDVDGTTRSFGPADGLGEGRVTAFFEDSRGIVWAGTSAGLSRYAGGRFLTLALTNLGRRQNVTAIVEDYDGNLWLGVLSGIMRIARADLVPSGARSSASAARWISAFVRRASRSWICARRS
jgi:ligand-binding sensor domain-containing protein